MSTGGARNAPPAVSGPSQPLPAMDPGAPPQPPVFTRPVVYVQAPAPPSLLQYPWTLPFPYHPLAGFPGVGYGGVMAPFPPPPFMEAPVYVLPHSYMQPLDQIRFNNTAGAPNLTRRAPVPAAFSTRGTVSTEVQTERPPRVDRGYDDVCSDSGNGTASTSPSSSSSASHKPGPMKRSSQEKRLDVGGSAMQHVGEKLAPMFLPSTPERQDQDGGNQQPRLASTMRSSHFNMWSQSSDEFPPCSSSQSKNVADRRTQSSFPNIGMLDVMDSRSPRFFQTKELPDKFGSLRESEANNDLSRSNHEILEPLGPPHIPESRMEKVSRELAQTVQCSTYRDEALSSLNTSQDCYEQGSLRSVHEDTSETIPHCMSSTSIHMRRNMNESLWSVESLEPFIPNREWLLRNGLFDTDVIAETEEDKDRLSTLKDDIFVSLKVRGQRDSDAVPVLDSRLVFSTPEGPGSPGPSIEARAKLTVDKVRGLSSPPQHVSTSTERNKTASVSGAECPKPQVVVTIPQLEQRPTSTVQVRVSPCLQVALEEGSVRGGPSPRDTVEGSVRGGPSPRRGAMEETQQLLVIPASAEPQIVSPSKRPLMDCGIQCTDLCNCGGLEDCGVLKDCRGTNPLPTLIGSGVKKVNDQQAETNPTDRRSSKPWKQSNYWRNRNPGGTGRATRH